MCVCVYHLQAGYQEPGSAPEPYAQQSSICCLYFFVAKYVTVQRWCVVLMQAFAKLLQTLILINSMRACHKHVVIGCYFSHSRSSRCSAASRRASIVRSSTGFTGSLAQSPTSCSVSRTILACVLRYRAFIRLPTPPATSWNCVCKISRTWKVLENEFGCGKSWISKCKVLELARQ